MAPGARTVIGSSRWGRDRPPDEPVKSLGFIFSYLATPEARRNLRILLWMLALLVVAVAVYSTLFHELMEREGKSHSWPTAVYWTLVTMSTLGFGDITFDSDLGRSFSVIVLLTGSVFILVLLPFTFIQFVFVPWVESRARARAPRHLGSGIEGHVLLTGTGPIESALIARLERAGLPYATVIGDLDEALRHHDLGLRVVVGALDDPEVWRAAGVERAALVAATGADTSNTHTAFTVREISSSVAIVGTANDDASVDILELAGCDRVLRLDEMLGSALARRVLAPDGRSQVIGEFGELLVAEATAPDALVGPPLLETGLRQRTGLTVAGVWDRGTFSVARPSSVLTPSCTLVLAGSRGQLDTYDELFGRDRAAAGGPVIIIGGGRVGQAASRNLDAAGVDHRIVEKHPPPVRDKDRWVVGDAADLSVLERAGLADTPSVIVTTHDDDVNVYLTIYCRRLRPDVQIIARARLDRNVSTLHRAGADFVLSYASTGANAIWNVLSRDNTLQLAEGLDVFRVKVPPDLAGVPLVEAHVRESTGCTVVAVVEDGRFRVNPAATEPLPAEGDLVLIGDGDSEDRFLSRYRPSLPGRRRLRPAIR